MRDRRRALWADRAAGSEVIGRPAAYDAEAEAKRLAYSSKLISLGTAQVCRTRVQTRRCPVPEWSANRKSSRNGVQLITDVVLNK